MAAFKFGLNTLEKVSCFKKPTGPRVGARETVGQAVRSESAVAMSGATSMARLPRKI